MEELTCLIHRGNRALQATSHSCSCSGCQSHQGLCPISSHLESETLDTPSEERDLTWRTIHRQSRESLSVNSGRPTGLPLLIATRFAVKSAWVGLAKNEFNDPNPLKKKCEPCFANSSRQLNTTPSQERLHFS